MYVDIRSSLYKSPQSFILSSHAKTHLFKYNIIQFGVKLYEKRYMSNITYKKVIIYYNVMTEENVLHDK